MADALQLILLFTPLNIYFFVVLSTSSVLDGRMSPQSKDIVYPSWTFIVISASFPSSTSVDVEPFNIVIKLGISILNVYFFGGVFLNVIVQSESFVTLSILNVFSLNIPFWLLEQLISGFSYPSFGVTTSASESL